MSYNPGITDRSGEILEQGIASAGQSIGEAIATYGAKRDELKGYRQIALALGLPPDQVDKMSAGEIKGHIMANEIRQQQQKILQKQKQQAAVGSFMTALAQKRAGGGPDFDRFNAGAGPVKAAPQGTLDATLGALAENPLVLNTSVGTAALSEALKKGMTTPKTPPQVIDQGGFKFSWEPDTGRTRPLPVPKPADSRTPANTDLQTKQVNGKTFYWDEATKAWKPVTGGADDLMAMMFPGGRGAAPDTGGGGTTPQPAMRFKRDDNGKLISY